MMFLSINHPTYCNNLNPRTLQQVAGNPLLLPVIPMLPDLQMTEMMMTCMVLVDDHIMMFAEILGEGPVMMISELLNEDVSCVHPCSHFLPVE